MWEFLRKPIGVIEEKMEMILDGFTALFFWVATILVFPGIFFWGQMYGIGCTGTYWDYCDNGVVGILYSGIVDASLLYICAVSIVFSKLILVRLGHRAEKD